MILIFKISIIQQKKTTYHEKQLFYSRKVSEHKLNGQMQNIQQSLVDRCSFS